MVFTPLLASTCVGTLECRAVALSLTDIQPRLKEAWVSQHPREVLCSVAYLPCRFFRIRVSIML